MTLAPEAIADPKSFADPDALDEMLAKLRREEPLVWVEPEGFRPFWLSTKYHDIKEIEAKPQTFLSAPRTVLLTEEVERINLETFGTINGVRTLVQMDDPDHFKYRHLTQAWFMPKNLKKLDGMMKDLAKRYVDRMEGYGGQCDFAADVAFWYPLRVILGILGLPESEEPMMLKLTQELFGGSDEEFMRDKEKANEQSAQVINDFIAYFTEVIENRRANPGDDVASVIANAEVDGKPIDLFEAMSYYIIVATAGHDTTSATTAGAMRAMIEDPDEFRKLKNDLSLLPGAIDEFVRWVTPVKHFIRTATEDYELRGKTIRKGDSVMLCYISANRDEEVWQDPFKFRVDRDASNHLAFGYGPHLCLGKHLAKMEMEAFYRELMPRLEHIEMAGKPAITESYFVSGLKRLPVRYRMTAPANAVA